MTIGGAYNIYKGDHFGKIISTGIPNMVFKDPYYFSKSGISKNTKNNQTVLGSPAMPKDQFIKSYIIFKKLPSIVRQIEKLPTRPLSISL